MSARETVLAWARGNSPIAVHPAYIRMAGDVGAGVLLSQIVYWHSDSKDGQRRGGVERDGETWVAKSAADWAREIGLDADIGQGPAKSVRRYLTHLQSAGLIEADVFKFNGAPTLHVRVNWTALESAAAPDFPYSEIPFSDSGISAERKMHFPAVGKSSKETETTSETTEPEAVANNATAGDANDASPGAAPGRIADVIEVALGQTFAPAADVVALVDGIEADKAKRRKPRPPNPWTETNEAYRLTFGLPAVASTWKLASLVVAVLREHGVAPADGPATWARFVAAMERAEKWHFVQAHNAGQWLAKWMVGAKAGRTGMVMKLGGVS